MIPSMTIVIEFSKLEVAARCEHIGHSVRFTMSESLHPDLFKMLVDHEMKHLGELLKAHWGAYHKG